MSENLSRVRPRGVRERELPGAVAGAAPERSQSVPDRPSHVVVAGAIQPSRLTTDELFRKHAPFVARLLHRLGVPTREIDDVVQQVFVVVHKNGGYVQGPATPTSYLGAIAVKAASSARRRDGAQRSRHAGYNPELLASSGRDPVSLLEVRSELTQLQAALDAMDADLRVVLVLTELEGESCAAIAASQGIPVGTVYWRAHRARKQFRKIAMRLAAEPKPRARPESESYEPHL